MDIKILAQQSATLKRLVQVCSSVLGSFDVISQHLPEPVRIKNQQHPKIEQYSDLPHMGSRLLPGKGGETMTRLSCAETGSNIDIR